LKTAEQRIEFGKNRRNTANRAAHGKLRLKYRRFEPIRLLLASVDGRVPELLPIKYARMSASPFAFFCGAVSIMPADLARLPHSGIEVQL
jgi:uncharacterized protein (DUF2252 family)